MLGSGMIRTQKDLSQMLDNDLKTAKKETTEEEKEDK